MSSNPDVKMLGYGAASAGGVILVKNLMNVDILPLSGTEDVHFSSPIPGLGDTPNLPLLEGENEPVIEGLHYAEEFENPIA